jgi:hypothetical protein
MDVIELHNRVPEMVQCKYTEIQTENKKEYAK